MKLQVIAIILISLLIFGCITAGEQENSAATHEYKTLMSKFIVEENNYLAEYEIINQIKSYKLNFLIFRDKEKFNMRIDVNLPAIGTNELISSQMYFLSEFNKAYACDSTKCVENSTETFGNFPTEEQIKEMLNDEELKVEFMPAISGFPEEAKCFRIVGSDLINCFLSDGIIAYQGNGEDYLKLINIERGNLTEDDFALPHVPVPIVEVIIEPPVQEKGCQSSSTGIIVESYAIIPGGNGVELRIRNATGQNLEVIDAIGTDAFNTNGIIEPMLVPKNQVFSISWVGVPIGVITSSVNEVKINYKISGLNATAKISCPTVYPPVQGQGNKQLYDSLCNGPLTLDANTLLCGCYLKNPSLGYGEIDNTGAWVEANSDNCPESLNSKYKTDPLLNWD